MHYSEYNYNLIYIFYYTHTSPMIVQNSRIIVLLNINYIDGKIQNTYLFISNVEISKISYVLVPTYELMKIIFK